MTLEEFIHAVHFMIPIVGIWVIMWLWRDYRVDALRERLFLLRQELFDYAASGNVPFNDPAYRSLRDAMDGMIRFAHKISFIRLVLSVIANRLSPSPLMGQHFRKWRLAVDQLKSQAVKDQLLEFHGKMAVAMVKHMVTGSPVMLTLLILFSMFVGAVALIRGAAIGTKRVFDAFISRLPGIELLEGQALAK